MEVTQNRSGPDALKLRFTKFGAGRVALCGGLSSVHHAGGLRQSALPRASHDDIFRESVRGVDTIHPGQSQADGAGWPARAIRAASHVSHIAFLIVSAIPPPIKSGFVMIPSNPAAWSA